MKIRTAIISACFGLAVSAAIQVQAETLTVTVENATTAGRGAAIGTVTFTDEPDGMLVTTQLDNLPPGVHKLAIHENPSCMHSTSSPGEAEAAKGAGDVLSMAHTTSEVAAPATGYKTGDMTSLTTDENGRVYQTMLIRGMQVSDIKERSVVIHQGPDLNPGEHKSTVRLTGADDRIACGVIR
ncbi:hypothetical protein C4J81_02805 [Deltaproteobacteria bacterium Smac51]|nr:hypothetical protein C4J81_02805 [Deltaproteobacteria bacterium Smac51]